MHLIEILLPLHDDERVPFPASHYEELAQRLTDAFGGVTSFERTPANGRWHDGGVTEREDIIVMEVMTKSFDREWWSGLKEDLRRKFRQKELVIRRHNIEVL